MIKVFDNRFFSALYSFANPSIYIDMFVCPELIEETARPIGLIFGILGCF